jgi:outer membrane murein-binding lipoprotein Lpp
MIRKLLVTVLVVIASLSIAGCTSSTNSNQTATSTPPHQQPLRQQERKLS